MKIATYTLGCKVNQYETQAIEAELRARGHTLVPFSGIADAYIINTCTVTALADKKSRQAISGARKLSSGAIIAVCGCSAQLNHAEMESMDIDIIGGSANRMEFIGKLEHAFKMRDKIRILDDALSRREFEMLPPASERAEDMNNTGGLSGRTRAFLKIQDGCSNFCAYCVIPFARGPARSMPPDDAAEYVKKLKDAGYRETVITGIEISSYGRDLKTELGELLPRLLDAAGDMRIRLGSLEPRTVTREFLEDIKPYKNLCPHFHLSLQSGCDETLLRMGRGYDTERFLLSCGLLREYFPGCAITADLIVGFPGETEAEFLKTLTFIRKCGFSAMHIFPYSRRKGTEACNMPCQIPSSEKKERAKRARDTAERMKNEYKKSQTGKTLSVLFEVENNGISSGHSENYLEVCVNAEGLRGKIMPVSITGIDGDMLLGETD